MQLCAATSTIDPVHNLFITILKFTPRVFYLTNVPRIVRVFKLFEIAILYGLRSGCSANSHDCSIGTK